MYQILCSIRHSLEKKAHEPFGVLLLLLQLFLHSLRRHFKKEAYEVFVSGFCTNQTEG